jgi:hypothetical protein
VTSALDFFLPAVSNRETTASVLITEGGMNLLDALRHAEQRGKKTAQRGAEKLHDLETAVRRRVRGQNASSASTSPDSEQERESSGSSKVRTGIVSVNGRDVGEMRCTGGRRTT